ADPEAPRAPAPRIAPGEAPVKPAAPAAPSVHLEDADVRGLDPGIEDLVLDGRRSDGDHREHAADEVEVVDLAGGERGEDAAGEEVRAEVGHRGEAGVAEGARLPQGED